MSRRTSPWCRTAITFLGDLEQVLGRLALLLIAMAAIAHHVYATWSTSYSGTRGVPDQTQSQKPLILPDGGNPQASSSEYESSPNLPDARRRAASPPVASTPSDAP